MKSGRKRWRGSCCSHGKLDGAGKLGFAVGTQFPTVGSHFLCIRVRGNGGVGSQSPDQGESQLKQEKPQTLNQQPSYRLFVYLAASVCTGQLN